MTLPQIYVSHSDAAMRNLLVAELEKLGHEHVWVSQSCAELKARCFEKRPDLIISAVNFPDGNGIDALIEIGKLEPTASIVVTERSHLEEVEHAMDDHVMAYLIEPVTTDDLKASIFVVMRRFEEFEALKEENDDLRDALATRKKLERAKGVLMAIHGVSEEDAYLRLRKQATDRRMKLADVADLVIEMVAEK